MLFFCLTRWGLTDRGKKKTHKKTKTQKNSQKHSVESFKILSDVEIWVCYFIYSINCNTKFEKKKKKWNSQISKSQEDEVECKWIGYRDLVFESAS